MRFCVLFLWYGTYIYVSSKRRGNTDRGRRIAELQSRGCAAICRSLGINVSVNGAIPRGKPMLIVSNHPGLLDPWVLASRFNVSFVAKKEMSRWPVFGPIGIACGLLFADRENRMRTGDLVNRIQSRMKTGIPVLVFPEGTTSGEDKVLRFKTGAFATVENMNDGSVLPVYMWAERINGENSDQTTRTQIFWPRDVSMFANARQVLSINSMDIEILVGSPISTASRNRKELAKIAHIEIETLEQATRIWTTNDARGQLE